MVKCKNELCKRDAWCKGFCTYHYNYERVYGSLKKNKCSVDGCNFGVYARGYCRNHHSHFLRKGTTEYLSHNCIAPGCTKKIIKNKYCAFHQLRIDRNVPLDTARNWAVRGKNNHNWNGGCSEYPNHYELKKNRILKLQESSGKCIVCGCLAEIIHHIDENKSNHSLGNLAVLCKKCHFTIHSDRKNSTSKYKRMYGYTLKEMSELFGGCQQTYWSLHKENKLSSFLNKQLTSK